MPPKSSSSSSSFYSEHIGQNSEAGVDPLVSQHKRSVNLFFVQQRLRQRSRGVHVLGVCFLFWGFFPLTNFPERSGICPSVWTVTYPNVFIARECISCPAIAKEPNKCQKGIRIHVNMRTCQHKPAVQATRPCYHDIPKQNIYY